MLLLLLTVSLNLPFFAAMVLTAGELIDLLKRDTAPLLTPTLVSSGRENQYVPAGLWHVHCLAATYHDSTYGNEE